LLNTESHPAILAALAGGNSRPYLGNEVTEGYRHGSFRLWGSVMRRPVESRNQELTIQRVACRAARASRSMDIKMRTSLDMNQ